MQKISLLIFDLDGTLVNTLDDIAASVNYALSRLLKGPITTDKVRQFVGDGTRVLLSRALGGDTEQVDHALGHYKEHYARNLVVHSSLYPGVRDTLDYFNSIPMAVISNKTREFIVPLMEKLGIAHYFKAAVGADRGVPLKPAPDPIIRIIAEAGAGREQTLVVGDGTTDVMAGRAAGALTCAVTYGFRTENELRKAGPDYIIHHISEMKRIFIPASNEDRG